MCIDSEVGLDFTASVRLKTLIKTHHLPILLFSVWQLVRSGETGGATRLTNTAPHVPPVLPATVEAARTTSATKVHCAS